MVRLFDKRQRSRNNERNWDAATVASQEHNDFLAQMLRDSRNERRNELEGPIAKKGPRVHARSNRHFTLVDKNKMVALRFGCLDDFRFKKMTYAAVADRMKCWVVNVFLVVKRFLANGHVHPPDGRTCRAIRPDVTDEMVEHITSRKMLEQF